MASRVHRTTPAHPGTCDQVLSRELEGTGRVGPSQNWTRGPRWALNFTSNLRSRSKDRPLLTAGQRLSVKHRLGSEKRNGESRTPRAHGCLYTHKVRVLPAQMPSLPALVFPGPSLHLDTFRDPHVGPKDLQGHVLWPDKDGGRASQSFSRRESYIIQVESSLAEPRLERIYRGTKARPWSAVRARRPVPRGDRASRGNC